MRKLLVSATALLLFGIVVQAQDTTQPVATDSINATNIAADPATPAVAAEPAQPVAANSTDTTTTEGATVVATNSSSSIYDVIGKVVDNITSKGIEGATVVMKGANIATTTGADGDYQLYNLPNKADKPVVLMVSATGYHPRKVTISNGDTIVNVQLVPSTDLDEVIVTALGIKRNKNDLPYAAQQVSGSEVTKARDNNFVNSLSGKVAGLQITTNNNIGGSTNVVLRGAKSLTGNNQALFVIDGIPFDNANTNSTDQTTARGGYDYGNAAADVNPDDIESITVLKGPSATVLYGSRASNGAVLITTKQGRKDANIGVAVNLGVQTGKILNNTFPSYQNQYGAGYSSTGYEDPTGSFFYRNVPQMGIDGVVTISPTKQLVVPSTEDASFGAKFDPNLMVYTYQSFDPTSPLYGKPSPWVAAKNTPKAFFQTPLSLNGSVFMSGGTDKSTFSMGYTTSAETGIVPNSSINKNTVNLRGTYKLTAKLTAMGSINFNQIQGKGRYQTGYGGDFINPITGFRQWWQTNVDVTDQKAAYFRTHKNVTWNMKDPGNPGGTAPIYWDNPYWNAYQNYETDERNRYFGYGGFTYEITKWLNVLARASLDSYRQIREERMAIGSLRQSFYQQTNNTFQETNYDVMINVNKAFGKSIHLNGVIGTNIRRTVSQGLGQRTNGGLVIPNLYALSNAANGTLVGTETLKQQQVDGYYASATIAYQKFLFLDLAGRVDQSSTLPKNNNAYFYPSASLGFVFSELMTQSKVKPRWLSQGKIRLNYAQVGNSAPEYALINTYPNPISITSSPAKIPSFGSAPLFSLSNTNNNPNLKPEVTSSAEVGLEMAFFKNRLGFDANVYLQNSTNQIVPVPVSAATGFGFTYINAGEIQNKGVEVTLYGTPVKTKDFSWTVNVNWAKNNSLVVDLAPGISNIVLASSQGSVSINATKGQPYGTIQGKTYVYNTPSGAYAPNAQPVLSQGVYLQTSSTNNVLGSYIPDWFGGIGNSFKYKALTLSILIDARIGGQLFSLDQYYGQADGIYASSVGNNELGNPLRDPVSQGGGILYKGVVQNADGTYSPNTTRAEAYAALGYQGRPASAYIYDASFVKLREVTITYTLPAPWFRKLLVKSADISISGRNLAILYKNLPYADPEGGMSSGNVQGYQVGVYPTVAMVGCNLKVTF